MLGRQIFLLVGLIRLLELLLEEFFVFLLVLLQFLLLQLLKVFVHFLQFHLVAGLELFYLVDVGVVAVFVAGDELLHFLLHFLFLLLNAGDILLFE